MRFSNTLIAILLTISVNNVSAIPLPYIDGDIAFAAAPGSSWMPTAADLVTVAPINTAVGIKFANTLGADGTVTSVTGSYPSGLVSLTTPTYVDFHSFVFNPLASGGVPLWTFSSGASTYSFSMSTITYLDQTGNTISLEGTGVASISDFEDTGGEFSLTVNENGLVDSFSSSISVVPVPPAVWLFASGLLGLVGIARRKAV